MEDLGVSQPFGGRFAGRRALVTGHTGFKGAWLSTWLRALGCDVAGLALAPATSPALADAPRFGASMRSHLADIRDRERVARLVAEVQPDYVFHLAAQSLVRASYEQPAETFETNVGGTVNVLEAVRRAGRQCSVIIVTTDKCYENREWLYAYREGDRLGGRDPYSASKAAAELATAAYVQSFFGSGGIAVSTVRAGNVVGGGDFSVDRLLPDAIRAFQAKRPLILRNPGAVRPWQYVLEPLAGYLALAARQVEAAELRGAWNFGPDAQNERTVLDVAKLAAAAWGDGEVIERRQEGAAHEASMLKVDSTKARTLLRWEPLFGIEATIERSVRWYRGFLEGAEAVEAMEREIAAYAALAAGAARSWTTS